MNKLIPYLETLITVLNDIKDEMKRSAAVDLGQYSPDLDRQLRQYELDHLTNKMELGAAAYDDLVRIRELKEHLSKSNQVTDTVTDSVRKVPPPGPGIIGETAPEMTAAPKRDWEVVEFINTDKHPSPGYRHDGGKLYDHCLIAVSNGDMAIHRVRRKSDGVEFEVNQMVTNLQSGLSGKIDKFEISTIDDLRMNALFTDSTGKECSKWLSNIHPAKVLFVTTDGVNIYHPFDIVYSYLEDVEKWTIDEIITGNPFRQFTYSTREAAQKAYDKWLFDQPVLKLSDIDDPSNSLIEVAKGRVSK